MLFTHNEVQIPWYNLFRLCGMVVQSLQWHGVWTNAASLTSRDPKKRESVEPETRSVYKCPKMRNFYRPECQTRCGHLILNCCLRICIHQNPLLHWTCSGFCLLWMYLLQKLLFKFHSRFCLVWVFFIKQLLLNLHAYRCQLSILLMKLITAFLRQKSPPKRTRMACTLQYGSQRHKTIRLFTNPSMGCSNGCTQRCWIYGSSNHNFGD